LTYLDGVEQTQHATTRVVEVDTPLVDGLQTVHHTSIVTVGRGSNEEQDDPGVENNKSGKRVRILGERSKPK
jgi:hypothetical protein